MIADAWPGPTRSFATLRIALGDNGIGEGTFPDRGLELFRFVKVAGMSEDARAPASNELRDLAAETRALREAVERLDERVQRLSAKSMEASTEQNPATAARDVELQGEGQERRHVAELPAQRTEHTYKAVSSGRFVGQDLTASDFSYSVISDADFQNAKLHKAVMKYTVASDARFQRADLRGALLRYSVLTDVRFTEADCRGTDFSYCLLTDADFSGADLRGAIFSNAMLGGRFDDKTVYDQSTKFPVGFDPKARGLTLKEMEKGGSRKSTSRNSPE